MNRVTIEILMWLGKELGDDFESPSEMRSIKEVCVEEGVTIRQLLANLAARYCAIAHRIFDQQTKSMYTDVVVIYNDMVISPYVVHEQILRDGDKITIFPAYAGG